jgi:hypothetical protein
VEIHPPHGAIRSWRDFLLQLGTITAGVLIALSFEGIREAIHDRSLVREARENIRREIADNRREIDGEIARIPGRTDKIETALRFTRELLRDKRTDIRQIGIDLEFPTLSGASWQTADRTGALAHMDYAEVQKYAALYAFQDFLSSQHRRAIDAMAAALGILSNSEGGDPRAAPPSELERFRQELVALKSILYVEEQMAHTASERYRKALE